jgi:hypothetical protein
LAFVAKFLSTSIQGLGHITLDKSQALFAIQSFAYLAKLTKA